MKEASAHQVKSTKALDGQCHTPFVASHEASLASHKTIRIIWKCFRVGVLNIMDNVRLEFECKEHRVVRGRGIYGTSSQRRQSPTSRQIGTPLHMTSDGTLCDIHLTFVRFVGSVALHVMSTTKIGRYIVHAFNLESTV